MYSVVETFEGNEYCSTAVQSIWLKNGKLYWPPGKNVDRRTVCIPKTDCETFEYSLLKSGIGKIWIVVKFDLEINGKPRLFSPNFVRV